MKQIKSQKLFLLFLLIVIWPIAKENEDSSIEFNGPKIDWSIKQFDSDTNDVINKLMQEKIKPPKLLKSPAYDFLNTEYLKGENYKDISDSLLDNVDLRKYNGIFLERFRIKFYSDPYTPTTIKIGKYRPGRYNLIIKYTLGNMLKNAPFRASNGIHYHLIDTLNATDSLKCSKIMSIVRNFHPIDTGLKMTCFHTIEYYCAYPEFVTFCKLNCRRIEDNQQYLELLKICTELIKTNISKEDIQKSYLFEFINEVSCWYSIFLKKDKKEIKKCVRREKEPDYSNKQQQHAKVARFAVDLNYFYYRQNRYPFARHWFAMPKPLQDIIMGCKKTFPPAVNIKKI
jgi:hypothetical protein